MDKDFYNNLGPFDLNFIADKIGGEIISPKNNNHPPKIENIARLDKAESTDLTFLSNLKYEAQLETTRAGACIVSKDIAEKYSFENLWLIAHSNPYFIYAKALDLFYEPAFQPKNKIEASAFIHESAKIGKNVYIGHNCIIEQDAQIGDNSFLAGNCYIGAGVKIGADCRIDSSVTINYAKLGDRICILPGARIGQDGFGFATEKAMHKKIFHRGRVIIEDDVEIGANSTIDRGALTDTIIEKFARIDNLAQIGHNVEIGMGSILVSQVGVAGSTKLGKYCAVGGQAGFAGHLQIADQVRIAGQSGVQHSIEESGSTHFGTPALPIREWQKQNIALKKLLRKKD